MVSGYRCTWTQMPCAVDRLEHLIFSRVQPHMVSSLVCSASGETTPRHHSAPRTQLFSTPRDGRTSAPLATMGMNGSKVFSVNAPKRDFRPSISLNFCPYTYIYIYTHTWIYMSFTGSEPNNCAHIRLKNHFCRILHCSAVASLPGPWPFRGLAHWSQWSPRMHGRAFHVVGPQNRLGQGDWCGKKLRCWLAVHMHLKKQWYSPRYITWPRRKRILHKTPHVCMNPMLPKHASDS